MSDHATNPAPTFGECLAHAGVPLHMHGPAKRALIDWLHSWDVAGCDETPASLKRSIMGEGR